MLSTKHIIAYSLLGLGLSSCLWFRPGPNKLTRRALKANEQYDAVIVPGVPFNAPFWDMTMKMRVIWATHLYKKGLTKNLIMSGSSVYSPYVESKIMKLYAVGLGVPEQHVYTEEKAEHTTENLWYSFKLGKALGFNKIALATDPFQNRLIYRFGKKRIKELHYLPVIIDTLKTLPHDTPRIDYHPLKIENFVPLPERESRWERLRGTWGKHINYKE